MPPKFKRSLSKDDLRTAADVERETLLEHDSDPDEDLLFNHSGASGEEVDDKLGRIQIREVTEVMHDNVQRVLERGERLEDLQDASDRLSMAGNEFRDAARKAQRRAWLQNVKTRIIVGTITMTIVLCIVVLDIMVLYLVLR